MKIIIKRFLPLLMIVWLGALPAFAQPRIATVDLQKVFEKYYRREQAQLALKDRELTFKKEIKSLRDDLDKIAADYDKLVESANDQSVTPEERTKRKALADTKLLEFKTAQNTLRTASANADEQLSSQQKRLIDSIFGEINDAIKAKAKASGFTLVLNTTAVGGSMASAVLYSNGDNDLTDTILAQLNVGAPPPTTNTDAPKTGDKSLDKQK